MWDLEARSTSGKLGSHESSVTAIVADFPKQRAISAGGDGSLRVWDLAANECISVLKEDHSNDVAAKVTANIWLRKGWGEAGDLSVSCVWADFQALRAIAASSDGTL